MYFLQNKALTKQNNLLHHHLLLRPFSQKYAINLGLIYFGVLKVSIKQSITYLPLDKFHIVPLDSLDPSSIKKSAKRTFRDREEIGHNTKLNAIAKILGIHGGFSSYEKTYTNELLPFLKKHNLINRKNLLVHKITGDYHLYTQFTHQQLSEKLFLSKNTIPNKLFTGHNFNFKDVHDWHNLDLDDALSTLSVDHIATISCQLGIKSINDAQLIDKLLNETVKLNLFGESVDCLPFDLLMLKLRNDVTSIYHLLGTNLSIFDNVNEDIVVELYAQKTCDIKKYQEDISNLKLFALFLKQRLLQSSKGWVNIHPFNENIIFLSDDLGNYDFVVRNQRDQVFDHQVFGDYLKRSDIPSCIEDYRFLRWHYFQYQGNRCWDNHSSELHYYAHGNISANYPGRTAILQKYLEDIGTYKLRKKQSTFRQYAFNQVDTGQKSLMISNLISIEELLQFLKENPDYANYRTGDMLGPVNSDENLSLPASLTYYDVLAYINWREQLDKIPYRLLTTDEYLDLHQERQELNRRFKGSDMRFFDLDGTEFIGHPPYVSNFDKLHLQFSKKFEMISFGKMNYVNSDYFCEWTMDGVQIRSKSLRSFYGDVYIKRSSGPRHSTGKYKGLKTGFRLCYELAPS